jgi:hypothetical protein
VKKLYWQVVVSNAKKSLKDSTLLGALPSRKLFPAGQAGASTAFQLNPLTTPLQKFELTDKRDCSQMNLFQCTQSSGLFPLPSGIVARTLGSSSNTKPYLPSVFI